MGITDKAGRLGSWAVFLIAWAGVLGAAVAITLIGVSMTGGAVPFRHWLSGITPYALLWRVVIYVVVGTLYITRWRPRLRAAQDQLASGGGAAHQRLIRIEQFLLVMIALIEAANLPDLIDWMTAG